MSVEKEILDSFRPQIRQALQDRLDALAVMQEKESRPVCCGKAMAIHDRRRVSCVSWLGSVSLHPCRYRCSVCGRERRPFLEQLEVEPGRPTGLLARLLGLLGCVSTYSLAADMAFQILGVKVSAMTVWRAVQRLGEAAARHTEALSDYHADNRNDIPENPHAPAAVVLEVDGAALGMQVRTKRRHRKEKGEALPALPPVEDGHFREVKTGVLLLPSERFTSSPERRSILRRVLVTCLGDADAIFARLWAQLRDMGWWSAGTVVVVVGDGSEWIWNRAAFFSNRCEILDFWHAIEYAWGYARLQFGEGTSNAKRWVDRVATDLRAGKVREIITRLTTLQPNSEESRQALESLIKYYTDNASRMHYDEYLRMGYGIGSGAVESAHKQVLHSRFRQAGMRWSELGARRLLALRLLLLNGNWSTVNQLRMVRIAA